ncbi:MAG: hypothetical protein FJ290_27390 [Planctomycetes bacterium]|nr:hypothetical protein [Planctomycetota bacterium]
MRGLGVMKLAREVGRAWVVGSVPLKLIVKPDIDVHVLVPRGERRAVLDAPEVSTALAIARRLMDRGVHKLELLRFYFRDAVKLGFDCRSPRRDACATPRTWHIDVWVTSDPEHTGVARTRWVRRRLTPGVRAAILKLKRYYARRDMCKFGMSGELYRAVITAGVRTPRQFLQYARTHELNYTEVLRMLEADARTWKRPPKRRTKREQ